MQALTPYLFIVLKNILQGYIVSAIVAAVILIIAPLFVHYILLYLGLGILLIVPILAPFIIEWKTKERVSPEGKAVFISGCDSGFGHMLAQKLDDLGYHVFAGCLFPDADGATQLRKSGSTRLHVVPLDVTNDNSVKEAAIYVEENLKNNVLWAVVNNAGINSGVELHWTDLERFRQVFEVNTFGVVRVSKIFLSRLKESKGRIVTVASTAGRFTCPGVVPYSMSKYATVSFCEGLRLEMYKWGIQVVTIEPLMYRTPIVDKERQVKNVTDTWAEAPADIKQMYGPNFIQKVIDITLSATKNFSNTNPSEVVAVLEEGVTAIYPKYSYSPGSLGSRIALWVVLRLPKPVVDYFFVKFLFDEFGEAIL